jgi:DNA-binding phage protein
MFQATTIVNVEQKHIGIAIHKKFRRTYMTRSSKFIEYMKLHLISLNQDYEKFYEDYLNDNNYYQEDIDNIRGQIKATKHLLSVATDIMNSSNERYNNGI